MLPLFCRCCNNVVVPLWWWSSFQFCFDSDLWRLISQANSSQSEDFKVYFSAFIGIKTVFFLTSWLCSAVVQVHTHRHGGESLSQELVWLLNAAGCCCSSPDVDTLRSRGPRSSPTDRARCITQRANTRRAIKTLRLMVLTPCMTRYRYIISTLHRFILINY